jgi:hypothetical protein
LNRDNPLGGDRTLSAADLDDLYALAKSESGIPDPDGRVPKELHDAQVAPQGNQARIVLLTTIKELTNVNALANGAHLPIAQAGVTVIYGENGVGKSGYSRVFKKACRARDRREPILPNANLEPGKSGPAQATFEAKIDGVATDLPWKDGIEPPEALSDIAIFDSHCARAYIDNQGDFAYSPYGLDILEGLVDACNKLKNRATAEKAANTSSNAAYAILAGEQTEVAKKLLGIPVKTTVEDIEALATLSKAEKQFVAKSSGGVNWPSAKDSRHRFQAFYALRQWLTAFATPSSSSQITTPAARPSIRVAIASRSTTTR